MSVPVSVFWFLISRVSRLAGRADSFIVGAQASGDARALRNQVGLCANRDRNVFAVLNLVGISTGPLRDHCLHGVRTEAQKFSGEFFSPSRQTAFLNLRTCQFSVVTKFLSH